MPAPARSQRPATAWRVRSDAIEVLLRNGDELELKLDSEEKVATTIAVRDFPEDQYLTFATEKGTVKKTALTDVHSCGWVPRLPVLPAAVQYALAPHCEPVQMRSAL